MRQDVRFALFNEYLLYLDQCHLCERGNRVPYFLKRFRDLCVNGRKGLRLLGVMRVGAYVHLFFVMVVF